MKVKFETELELDMLPEEIAEAVEYQLDAMIGDMIKNACRKHHKELESHAKMIGDNVLRSSRKLCESANNKVAENTFLKYEIDRLEKALNASKELLNEQANTR